MKISVVTTSKSKQKDLVLSDSFLKDYNETLIHQAVTTYLLACVKVLISKRIDLKLEVVEESPTDKKGQDEQEAELTPALSGEEGVSPLLPDHEIIQRK